VEYRKILKERREGSGKDMSGGTRYGRRIEKRKKISKWREKI
jgi:hypothetical protein